MQVFCVSATSDTCIPQNQKWLQFILDLTCLSGLPTWMLGFKECIIYSCVLKFIKNIVWVPLFCRKRTALFGGPHCWTILQIKVFTPVSILLGQLTKNCFPATPWGCGTWACIAGWRLLSWASSERHGSSLDCIFKKQNVTRSWGQEWRRKLMKGAWFMKWNSLNLELLSYCMFETEGVGGWVCGGRDQLL